MLEHTKIHEVLWRDVLHGEIRLSPERASTVITVCAILHNLCKRSLNGGMGCYLKCLSAGNMLIG